jgi:putative addiction module killer protein
MTIEIEVYIDETGSEPFRRWVETLPVEAAARIAAALYRIQGGHIPDWKPVGAGVFECRLHFGPGYRIYFGRSGPSLIVLLGGGTKSRQSRDIEAAIERWRRHKLRADQNDR